MSDDDQKWLDWPNRTNMTDETSAAAPRFDARDRSALAFLLDLVKRLRKPHRWSVFYGNYFPREVDSVHVTKEAADARAEELDGDWNVEPI